METGCWCCVAIFSICINFMWHQRQFYRRCLLGCRQKLEIDTCLALLRVDVTKMTTSSASGVVIGRPGENTRCKLELTSYCLDVQGVCCKQLMYMCCTHRSAIYSVTPLSSRGILFPTLVFSCFCHLLTSFFPINRSSVKTLGCQLRRLTSL